MPTSLFIAEQAFPSAADFSAVKIAVFAASILSAVVGTALLWGALRQELIEEAPQSAGMARQYQSLTARRSARSTIQA